MMLMLVAVSCVVVVVLAFFGLMILAETTDHDPLGYVVDFFVELPPTLFVFLKGLVFLPLNTLILPLTCVRCARFEIANKMDSGRSPDRIRTLGTLPFPFYMLLFGYWILRDNSKSLVIPLSLDRHRSRAGNSYTRFILHRVSPLCFQLYRVDGTIHIAFQ